jgi:DnaJ family protein C protein 8
MTEVSEKIIQKIISQNSFKNPYSILEIPYDATDDQIKKQYRKLALLIHPDKCRIPQSSDAFHILEEAYSTLLDNDKKNYFKRIYREAKDRIEYQRQIENKKRIKKGLNELPLDNINEEIDNMIKNIFKEIEEKKTYSEKMKFIYKKREREENEKQIETEEKKKIMQKNWEKFRDRRVRNWNRFKHKKHKKNMLIPPSYKTEERNDEEQNKISIYYQKNII